MSRLSNEIEFIAKSLELEIISDKPKFFKYKGIKINAEMTLTPKTKIANLKLHNCLKYTAYKIRISILLLHQW